MKAQIRTPVILAAVFGVLAAIQFSPRFLLYADEPAKVDAVVVYLGPDFKARKLEAEKLIKAGYARYLIVPAYCRVSRLTSAGNFVDVEAMPPPGGECAKSLTGDKEYLEDTHRETLIACELTTNLGVNSIIFVSSPYHMRRIKIIVQRVFRGNRDTCLFVPDRFKGVHSNTWWFSQAERKWVFREYLKIAWFILYSNNAIRALL
jgi:DUF218 domain